MMRNTLFSSTRRKVAAGLLVTAVLGGSVTSYAAVASPSLKLAALDSNFLVASASHFPASADVEFTAEVDGGSGTTTIKTSANGHALVAFETPADFEGNVTVTATSGDTEKSTTTTVGSGETTVTTRAKTTGTATAKKITPTTAPKATTAKTASSACDVATGTSDATIDVEESTGGVQGGARRTTNKSETVSDACKDAVAATATGAWLSGGTKAALGDYRGAPVQSISTWDDAQDSCENAWSLEKSLGEAGGDASFAWAIGGMWGQGWDTAANGGLDDVWTKCLTSAKRVWGSRDPSKLYISLFHESNGTWYDWSLRNDGDAANMKKAFHRFKGLKDQIMPGANLGITLNADQNAPVSREASVPNAEDLDFLGVDYYQQHWPRIDFGIFPALAKSHGVPLVVQEWGFKPDGGSGYVQYMHDQFAKYGGTGPGQLVMENYFDITANEGSKYEMSAGANNAGESAKYKELF